MRLNETKHQDSRRGSIVELAHFAPGLIFLLNLFEYFDDDTDEGNERKDDAHEK